MYIFVEIIMPEFKKKNTKYRKFSENFDLKKNINVNKIGIVPRRNSNMDPF